VERKVFFPYQRAVSDWASSRQSVALFLEMRLGKTLVTLRWLEQRLGSIGSLQKGGWRALVVCPKTVIPGWLEEAASESLPAQVLKSITLTPAHGLYLINYEQVRLHPRILDLGWDAVVLDESTRIKNPKSKISKVLTGVFWAPHRAILSGLPAPESDLDYFQQMKFLSPQGRFMGCKNFWEFRNRFCVRWGYDWTLKPGVRKQIKAAVSRHAYVLSRKHAKVGSLKLRESRHVELTSELKKEYRHVKKLFATQRGDETKYAVVRETWLLRIAGGFHPTELTLMSKAKLNELQELLTGELKGQSVVVWCRFTAEIKAVSQFLADHGHPVLRLTGALSPEKRNVQIQRFRKRPGRVLVSQIKLGKFGLDLSVADTAIYYSNTYSMEDRYQSEDRIISPTKKTPVLLIDLIAKGTVDEVVLQATRLKYADSKSLLAMICEHARS